MGDVVKLLRVGVAGAAGMLGRELLAVLESRKLPIVELLPIGSETAEGEGVEFLGADLPLLPPDTALAGLDLLFVCAPAQESLEIVRRALRARVPCFDLSGALAGSPEVPLLDAETDEEGFAANLAAPVVSVAGGPALAWSRVLRALGEHGPIASLQITGLESASTAGHRAFTALSLESASLLNQQEAPEGGGLPWPQAFDCHAATDETDVEGSSGREVELAGHLRRLRAAEYPIDCTVLRVPTFTGEGASLAVETAGPVSVEAVAAQLGKTPGIEVPSQDRGELRTRASTGRENVVVGRLRAATRASGVLMWLTADTQRLTALNAVRLAELRQALPTEDAPVPSSELH